MDESASSTQRQLHLEEASLSRHQYLNSCLGLEKACSYDLEKTRSLFWVGHTLFLDR